MRDKKKELNDILAKYDTPVQHVYQQVLKHEKSVKSIRKDQMKSLIDNEIMERVKSNVD